MTDDMTNKPEHAGRSPDARHRISTRVAVLGLGLAMATGTLAALAGLGSRWNWWNFRTGFLILQWAAYLGVVGAAVSLAGIFATAIGRGRRALAAALAGLLLSALVVGTLWHWKQTAVHVPPIHDISTDTDDPPAFVAVLPLRADAPNPAVYGGPEIAAQQHKGYPDLVSTLLSVPPGRAFEMARKAADDMCWKIVDANPGEGRIEATATTLWFGFKDDIVIRIRPVEGGSRIDIRSVSRVGRSDVGTNAKRIRLFQERVRRNA